MKTPKTSQSDDFSFSMGDEFEFFPLENTNNKEKPPKNAKGYFKNVVASVGRLGTKVAKDLYPEAFNFKDQLMSDTGGAVDVKGTIKNINAELKKYGSIAVDVSKEIRKDMKSAITTGEFSKEDEIDMGDMFGDDFDFGGFGDDDFGGDYDSNESEEPDNSGKKKSKISTKEITAKSALATANLDIKLTNKQIAATAGITQAHIKQEKLMFAQSISIFQEQHRQKMQVMKNIASNLSKVVTQNNLSNRAQMEFSAKQLAFSQDLTALVKEIRNAQWLLTKPQNPKEDEQSKYQKHILGGGFNLKFLRDRLKETFNNSGFGSMFGMAKEGIDSIIGLGDMAGGPAKMIKSMIYDGVRRGIEDRLISGNTRNLIEDVNLKMAGIPGALNRKFGQIGRDKDFSKNTLAAISKLPGGKAIAGMLERSGILDTFQSTVKSMQEVDQVKESTDKYKLKQEDLGKPHPFDNLAHKTLTETIPNILARIDAGVNNTEQYFFDPISNSFKTHSQMDDELKENQRSMTESKAGVMEYKQLLSNRFSNIKDEKLKSILNDNVVHGLTENLMKDNLSLDEIQNMLSSKDQSVRDDILSKLTANAGLKDLDEYELNQVRKALRGSIIDLKETSQKDGYNNTLVKFLQSKDSYASDLSRVNMEFADRYSSNSSVFNSKYDKAQAEKQIKVITEQVKAKQNQLKNKKLTPSTVKKIQGEISTLNDQLVELRRYTKGGISSINSGESNVDTSTLSYAENVTGDIDKYALEDLNNDNTTQGIVKNIYQLLLEGIDVYTHEASGPRKNIEARKQVLSKKHEMKQEKKLATLASDSGMIEFDASMISQDGSYEKYAFEKGIQLFKKNDETGKMERVKITKDKIPNDILYCRSSDYTAMQTRQAKESARENLKDNDLNKWLDDDNGGKGIKGKAKRFIKKLNVLESGNSAIAGFGSKFLGKHLYGEEYADLDAAEAKIKAKAAAGMEKVKDKVEDAKDAVKGMASKFEDKYNAVKTKASNLKTVAMEEIERNLSKLTDPKEREAYLTLVYNKYDAVKDKAGNIVDIARFKAVEAAGGLKDVALDKYGLVKDKMSKLNFDNMKDKAKSGFEKMQNLGVEGIAGVVKDKVEGAVDTVKTQVPKAMEKFKNKALPGALGKIKMGKQTLMDHLIRINDTQLMQELSKAETVKEKISVLRNHGSEQAMAIANKLDAEVKKRPMIAGALGAMGAAVGFGLSKITGAADTIINKTKERFAGQADEDGIHGNDADEQRELAEKRKQDKKDEADRKLQEERNESIDKIAKLLDKQSKDGINISDDSVEKIGDAAGSAAGSAGGSGITGKIADAMDKMGLGKYSKYVRGAGKALDFVKDTKLGKFAGKFGKFPGKGLIGGGGVGRIAKSAIKGFQHGGVKGGMKAAGKASMRVAKATAQNITKGAANAAAKGGGIIAKAGGLIKKLFETLMSKGPLAKAVTSASKNTILNSITTGLKKFAGKLVTKLTTFVASYASVIAIAVPVASAVVGFTKGMANAKKYFKVGKGMKVPVTMRLACGLADALDGLLMGIPGLIAKLAGKESLAVMFYDLISSPESKAALTRYMQYNTKRAKIYGVASGDKLSEYENRNIAQKGLRAIGSFITGGLVDSNDEKEAKILGFCSADIYKYWKENKYEPLQALYEEIVNTTDDKGNLVYGGKEVVEDFNNDSMIYNDDGEVIEDDEKNKEALDRIDKQNEFRKIFLQQAINKVKELGVAWCTSDCSIQLFEKMTGKPAKELQSTGEKVKDKVKSSLAAVGSALKTMIKWSPAGMAFRGAKWLATNTKWGQKATKAVQDFGNRIKASLKGKNLRDMMYKFFNYSDNTQKVMEEGTAEIQSVYSNFIDPEEDPGSAGAAADGAASKTIPGIEAGGAEPVGKQFVIQTQKLEQEKAKRGKNTFPVEAGGNESITDEFTKRARQAATKLADSYKPQTKELTDKYNKEIIEKLDILRQINEEQIRHNDVTEKFFESCLAMMAVIAKSNGKPQIASEMDRMIKSITK